MMHKRGRTRMLLLLLLGGTRFETPGIAGVRGARIKAGNCSKDHRGAIFRILSVPRDLAAQTLNVLVKDPEGLSGALVPVLVPVLNPPEHSPDLFAHRARARDRNHFAFHRVFEVRRGGGGVRRKSSFPGNVVADGQIRLFRSPGP
jgi:hypothetical protein